MRRSLHKSVFSRFGYVPLILCLAGAPGAWAADECSVELKVTAANSKGVEQEEVKIRADEIIFPARKVVLLRGYTQLIRGGLRVYADELVYYKLKNKVEASGVVKLETAEGDVVETSILTYDLKTGIAVSGPAIFSIADRKHEFVGSGNSSVNAHGSAERVTFEGENIMFLESAEVTSCLDGAKDITFNADELRVDLDEGVRTGSRVKIQIAEPNKHKRAREKLVIN